MAYGRMPPSTVGTNALVELPNHKEGKMKVGDKVEKYKGSYRAYGTIIAVATTSQGAIRYVVEYEVPEGLLHIHSDSDLRLINKTST